ncbi:Auxin-induced protein 5NG4 [Hordeum vulgare]|nr:Auxin-induced protein 5NG4 [Hordeum vulgare]
MFILNEVRDHTVTLLLLTVTFANHFDTHELLGRVYWCGCESILFMVYNIFTNYEYIFPTENQMHSLPYEVEEEEY